MDRNQEGFVLCMLKEIGMVDYEMDRGTFVLAYYNHINACRITDFKNYRSLATQLATSFAGERKQLLLYRLKPDSKHQLIYSGVTDNDADIIFGNLKEGKLFSNEGLFFNSENGAGLLGISVFKINEALKKPLFEQYKGNLENELAKRIYALLGTPDGMSYECFGTLGGEDLCVISVSSRFELIYDLVDKLRSMTVHVLDAPKESNTQTLFQNSYSALVIGDSGDDRTVQWGDARAHIFASVKGNAYEGDRKEFNKYLETINETLDVKGGNYCVGEYDYLWECAAEKISIGLYIHDGVFSRTNSDYQNYLFRTSTVILAQKDSTPAGEDMDVGICLSLAGNEKRQDEHDAQILLRQTIEQLHKSLDSRESEDSLQDGQRFGYIDQALSLLCKDYMSVHDMPSCGEWQQELWEQYTAVMEGICFHAKSVHDESSQTERQKKKAAFDADFEFVVSSLHQSFSDISQIDSLYYEKLNSNLHNSGAYVQILRAYYEIIKNIIRIFYAVPRETDIPQDEIIPIVVLGLTPKITAQTYSVACVSEDSEKAKVLVVITLPYQALSNIPKYIGPLFHELFHNFVPTSVRMYSYYYGASLCAVLIREYIVSLLQTLSKLEPFSLPDSLDVRVGRSYSDLEKSSLADVCNEVFLQMHEEIYSLEEDKYLVTFDHYKNIVNKYLLDMAPLGTEGKETVYERFLVAFLQRQEDPLVGELTNGLKVAYDKWRKDQGIAAEEVPSIKDGSERMLWDREFIKYIHHLVVEKQSVRQALTNANGLFWGMWNEIFPDLYDISLLIPEDKKADRLPQYLWQIYSVRNDIDPLADMQYDKDPKITANDLRIGMVVDILWRQNEEEELNEQILKQYLEQTLDESRPEIGKKIMIDWSVYNYRMYRTWLSPLWSIAKNVEGVISNQLEKLLSADTAVLDKLKILQNFYRRYYNEAAKQTQQLFGLCLDIIQEYGHPSDYTKVPATHLKTKWVHPSLDIGGGDVDFQRQAQKYIESVGLYEVDNPEDMFKALEDIYSHNGFLKERKLWFRGETDAERKCLPSLMRSSQSLDEPLADIVRREIRYAKAKLYSFVKTSGFNDSDWMALLQHYDIPTPILDWSEDFPTSLFFATGRWLTGKKQDKDAAIYTLDPVLMNMVARLMNDKDNKEISIKERIENDKNELESDHAIGDLPFFSEEIDVRQYPKHASTISESRDMDLAGEYPIAGRVRMNNNRMVAQAGAFVFPNIHSKNTTPPERNQYYNLHMVDALQEQYVELLMENGVKSPVLFLNKIVLSHRHWERFKEFTRHIGMSKDVVYPELSEMRDEIDRICQTGLK